LHENPPQNTETMQRYFFKTVSKALSAVLMIIFSLGIVDVKAQDDVGHARSINRAIEFPDIPGYQTLTCDFHQHTVFSDGLVWPSIRVEEAVKDKLDAISITDHIEYQPHKDDIPHPNRNRPYEIAVDAAKRYKNHKLIVVNGVEITRSMPPGHANAIFIEDANKLMDEDPMKVFREAKRQDAFIFWNHPNWISQQPDGIATLTDMHINLIKEGLLHGIEIVNDLTYSDEAIQIALDNNLTMMGTSDIHGLVDWQYRIPEGGHRPVTLVFATEKSAAAIKEGLENQRTVVWYNNILAGRPEFLVPLIEASLKTSDIVINSGNSDRKTLVYTFEIENHSDADYILRNTSGYTFHNYADVIFAESHKTTKIQVKTIEEKETINLSFRILNAVTAPGEHPEVSFSVSVK
jgi:hypothetical protein